MSVPANLKYTKDHEWIKQEGDVVVVGITDHAQQQLGDVVFVELPSVGASLTQGTSFGTVESVKAVSDLFAPISGTVTETNGILTEGPDAVNSDPYGKAWLIKLKPSKPGELEALMSAAEYEKSL